MSTTKTPKQIAQNFIKKANIVLKYKRNEIKRLEEIRKKYIEEAESEKDRITNHIEVLRYSYNNPPDVFYDLNDVLSLSPAEHRSHLESEIKEEMKNKINRNIENFNTETDSKILQIQREISDIELEIARMECLSLTNKIQK